MVASCGGVSQVERVCVAVLAVLVVALLFLVVLLVFGVVLVVVRSRHAATQSRSILFDGMFGLLQWVAACRDRTS